MAERRRNSNSQILQELDALSQTVYQPHANRRTASLAIPRSAAPSVNALQGEPSDNPIPNTNLPVSSHRPRPRRMSMSPFRSRTKSHTTDVIDDSDDDDGDNRHAFSGIKNRQQSLATATVKEKKGIWGWKPLRALTHLVMQKLGCLFSVEVVAIQGLPASMNGLRLSVAVRKKETKDGAVQTMPARVLQGAADFEETLFIRCHVYCSGKPLKFEPHPFIISAVAYDAPELDFGKSTVDLSLMVKESMERNLEGERIRQWDTAFPLAGKAKGGELVVKLGFQIMDDGGVEIYKQAEGSTQSSKNKGVRSFSPSLARRQSKSAFSVSSPKISKPESSMTPAKGHSSVDLRGIDEFNLDEPEPEPEPRPSSLALIQKKPEPEWTQDELDLPDFEIIDKGVEIQKEEKEEKEAAVDAEAQSESAVDEASVSSEVVKEVVHDSAHSVRLTELDAIAQQIKALESMVSGDGTDPDPTIEEDHENQQLDAEEDAVTREFLQLLELDDAEESMFDISGLSVLTKPQAEEGADQCFLSDLGKGLGSIVRTRDGGYLASMNPFDVEVARKETPKLAMQISKPIVLQDEKLGSGLEVFQKLAAMGSEELGSKLASLTAMDELMGKTAEQIAFEGIASAIISGRNKEGATSSAAKSVAALKSMSATMNDGRKERIVTGLWNVKEDPITLEEILPFSLQKIETMAVEALKIQAEMADEDPPFDISSLSGQTNPLDSTILLEDCLTPTNVVTLLVVIQLRDPLRRYETVGAPAVALIQATQAEDEEGEKFKVTSLHLGGMKVRSGEKKSVWDGEKQRLTALQWLVAYGLGKAGKLKGKNAKVKRGQDSVWSISSRMMADMWLKPMRNPDVKFADKS